MKLDQYFGTKSLAKAAELYEIISKERFSLKDIGTTHRSLQYWNEVKILSSHRSKKSGWHKFSFVQYVWIKIIQEMRSMDVPVSVIEKMKQGLFEVISFKEILSYLSNQVEIISKMDLPEEEKRELIRFLKKGDFSNVPKSGITYLHLLIAETIVDRAPVSIMVFKNGYWLPHKGEFSTRYSLEDQLKINYETCIRVPIAGILAEFIATHYENELLKEAEILNEDEIFLLSEISKRQFKRIEVESNKDVFSISNQPDCLKISAKYIYDNNYSNIKIIYKEAEKKSTKN